MPDKYLEFGRLGARGIEGFEAAARRLDQLVAFVATPVTQHRGMMARLHYLTRSEQYTASNRRSIPGRQRARHSPHSP
ncbi:hypothetical protein [Streptomyces sp. NPDC055400]